MIEWGAEFDQHEDGLYKLGKEGGHSEHRILHHKDVTGQEIERALLKAIEQYKNIQIINHCFVVDFNHTTPSWISSYKINTHNYVLWRIRIEFTNQRN